MVEKKPERKPEQGLSREAIDRIVDATFPLPGRLMDSSRPLERAFEAREVARRLLSGETPETSPELKDAIQKQQQGINRDARNESMRRTATFFDNLQRHGIPSYDELNEYGEPKKPN